jgi:DNA damage-binding protein 1
VVIAKSRHLEVRRLTNSESNETASLPIILSAPLNGRITNILPFTHPSSDTDYIFFTTETKRYAVISYAGQEQASSSSMPGNQDSRNIRNSTSTTPYNIITHATGNLADYGLAIRGNEPESGPLAAIEPNHKCIALHFYEGFVTFLPIHSSYRYRGQSNTSSRAHSKKSAWEFLGPPNHCRIEERDVFCMTFLLSRKEKDENVSSLVGSSRQQYMPQLVLLHQDSRGNQHVVAHSVDLVEKSLILHNAIAPIGSHGSKVVIPPLVEHRLKKSRVDGSSGLVIAVPPVGWSNGDSGIEGSGGMKMDADDNMNEDSKVWPSDSNGACSFGGVLILGEKQITYHDTSKNVTKILPISQFITLSYAHVHPIGST